jgi:arsenite methyltransferase
MAERVFAQKLEKIGFADVTLGTRIPFGIEHAALFPLFTPDLLALMRRLIPAERQGCVAASVIARARKP